MIFTEITRRQEAAASRPVQLLPTAETNTKGRPEKERRRWRLGEQGEPLWTLFFISDQASRPKACFLVRRRRQGMPGCRLLAHTKMDGRWWGMDDRAAKVS